MKRYLSFVFLLLLTACAGNNLYVIADNTLPKEKSYHVQKYHCSLGYITLKKELLLGFSMIDAKVSSNRKLDFETYYSAKNIINNKNGVEINTKNLFEQRFPLNLIFTDNDLFLQINKDILLKRVASNTRDYAVFAGITIPFLTYGDGKAFDVFTGTYKGDEIIAKVKHLTVATENTLDRTIIVYNKTSRNKYEVVISPFASSSYCTSLISETHYGGKNYELEKIFEFYK